MIEAPHSGHNSKIERVRQAYLDNHGNVTATAKSLGMTRDTVRKYRAIWEDLNAPAAPEMTDKSREAVDALVVHKTRRAAAAALGISFSAFMDRIARARATEPETVARLIDDPVRAARQGFAPELDLVHEVPDGLTLKGTSLRYNADGAVEQYWNKTRTEGRDPEEAVKLPDPKKITKVSTLYDQAGKITQQWVSEKPEDIAREALWVECARGFADAIPRAEPTKAPEAVLSHLLAGYPIGDMHIGMHAWNEEAGQDYDLAIAEKLFVGAFGHLVGSTPASAQALIAVLGDFTHYDSRVPETPAHKNPLDADGRFAKMIRVAIRCLRRAISLALAHHGSVRVIIEPGNHDPFSSVYLTESMVALYENEPRVSIDPSPRLYHYFSFGANLIGTHHGDKAKMRDLPLIMATDQPEAWGRAKYKYWWTGHVHRDSVVDVGGVRVESFRVLPPTDAWAYGEGYRSQRSMTATVYHERHGEVIRNTVNPSMLDMDDHRSA